MGDRYFIISLRSLQYAKKLCGNIGFITSFSLKNGIYSLDNYNDKQYVNFNYGSDLICSVSDQFYTEPQIKFRPSLSSRVLSESFSVQPSSLLDCQISKLQFQRPLGSMTSAGAFGACHLLLRRSKNLCTCWCVLSFIVVFKVIDVATIRDWRILL